MTVTLGDIHLTQTAGASHKLQIKFETERGLHTYVICNSFGLTVKQRLLIGNARWLSEAMTIDLFCHFGRRRCCQAQIINEEKISCET